MIRVLKRHEIDEARWDALIDQSPNGLIYAYSWYLDIISEKNWEAVVEGDYERVLPLIYRKKWGITYLFQSYCTQQLGIFGAEASGQQVLDRFLNAIPKKFRFIDIRFNTDNVFEQGDFELLQHRNFELNLHSAYSELQKGYGSNTRRNIKKAEGFGLKAQVNDVRASELIALFRENKGQELEHLDPYHFQTLQWVFDAAEKRSLLKTYSTRDAEGQLLAGAVFLITDRRMILMLTANHPVGKEKRAMFFLIDSVIRQEAGRDLVFDFEGSNDPGLARFYAGFGSVESVYLHIRQNRLPVILKWLKR